MVRTLLPRLLLAAGFGLAAGCCECSEFSLFHRRPVIYEGTCTSCEAGNGCCEGPALPPACPAPVAPAMPPVPPVMTPPVAPQLSAPPRLVPQPQFQPQAQPAPYTPGLYPAPR